MLNEQKLLSESLVVLKQWGYAKKRVKEGSDPLEDHWKKSDEFKKSQDVDKEIIKIDQQKEKLDKKKADLQKKKLSIYDAWKIRVHGLLTR